MSALILLVLLVGGVLYLGGGLWQLYRYLQARRMHPETPRLWDRHRRRLFGLTGVGVLLIAGFGAVAWWSLPGKGPGWLAPGAANRQAASAAGEVKGRGQSVPPPQFQVRGAVPLMPETVQTTSTAASTTSPTTTSTTESTVTTSTTTTSTTESTATTSPAPAAEPVAKAPSPAEGSAWTVCAASFRRQTMAQNYARRLQEQGLPARVSQVDLGERGTWHRVCVGGFATLEEAKEQYQAWERQGLISDAFLLPLR